MDTRVVNNTVKSLDPRRVLSSPAVYTWFSALVRPNEWAIFAREYIRAKAGDRILDIGCGPGDLLAELPEGIAYVGFDQEERYIRAARRRFGARGTFICRTLDPSVLDEVAASPFDIVVANGVLHHLSDQEAHTFFALARAALRPGGRLVTADGCYTPAQSRVVRYLLSLDRGQHVRWEESYVALAAACFGSVRSDIRHDTFRIPYTIIFMECVA